jgi:hypothetical protein
LHKRTRRTSNFAAKHNFPIHPLLLTQSIHPAAAAVESNLNSRWKNARSDLRELSIHSHAGADSAATSGRAVKKAHANFHDTESYFVFYWREMEKSFGAGVINLDYFCPELPMLKRARTTMPRFFRDCKP